MGSKIMVCGQCFTFGEPLVLRAKNAGDHGIGCLALCLGVPGLLFFWPLVVLAGGLFLFALTRMVVSQANAMAEGSKHLCRTCGSRYLIRADTPAAHELMANARAAGLLPGPRP